MSLIYSTHTLPIGSRLPDFSLSGCDDALISLSSAYEYLGVVVFFTCNHCPYARALWPLMIDYSRQYQELMFFAINSNDAVAYPADSFLEMQKLVDEIGVPFPYLYDETQDVARAYHAVVTPDIYVGKRVEDGFELFYHGRIHDALNTSSQVTERNFEEAVVGLINGSPPPLSQSPSRGCSIKWK